eukprot:1702436-Prymnesium_polylepis.1
MAASETGGSSLTAAAASARRRFFCVHRIDPQDARRRRSHTTLSTLRQCWDSLGTSFAARR